MTTEGFHGQIESGLFGGRLDIRAGFSPPAARGLRGIISTTTTSPARRTCTSMRRSILTSAQAHRSQAFQEHVFDPLDGPAQGGVKQKHPFTITSDDGARLWVNHKPIISNWSQAGVGSARGSITLVAGKNATFKSRYRQKTGGRACSFSGKAHPRPRRLFRNRGSFPAMRISKTRSITRLRWPGFAVADGR